MVGTVLTASCHDRWPWSNLSGNAEGEKFQTHNQKQTSDITVNNRGELLSLTSVTALVSDHRSNRPWELTG